MVWLTAAIAGHCGSIEIGSRRELFVDEFLIERFTGKAALRLHHPEPREVALVHDAPWEGNGSGFHSIFQDGDRYRLFYKAWNMTLDEASRRIQASKPFCCYAESADGIHWRKPALNLHEFQGAKANNIVMPDYKTKTLHVNSGAPAVFRDENPAAAPDARYKAMFQCLRPKGMIPFKSPDGLNWTPMSERPVITDGAFDSQNTAFWDGARGVYRAYWRHYSQGDNDITTTNPHGDRAIRTATSKDFLHWEMQTDLRYTDSPPEALYTNAIKPYHRAPHLLIGFPTRYVDRGWSDSNTSLPEREHREQRRAINPRYGNAMTEGLMMTSRDGVTFKRWNEAFLRPGIEREGTWNYGQQFIGWHVVETKSALEGAPNELSLYASESYWTGNSSALRRYTLRMDGFASASAPMSGGEIVTKPLTFAGSRLVLNFASSAAGGLQVELQDEAGKPLPGFALDDCPPIFGDSLERTVTWKSGGDVSALAGRSVRLRFALKDADLFSFQFNVVP